MSRLIKPYSINWNSKEKEFLFDNDYVLKNGAVGHNGYVNVQGYRLVDNIYKPNEIIVQCFNSKGNTNFNLEIPKTELIKFITALQEFKDGI
jgi:hypothetical protein